VLGVFGGWGNNNVGVCIKTTIVAVHNKGS